jgi:hypothetical protein
MKKLILFITLFLVGNGYGQTITINNSSTLDFDVLDFFDMDCAGNDNGCTPNCYTSLAGGAPLVLTGSVGFGHFPKINLREVISGAVVSLYAGSSSGICFAGAGPTTATLGGTTLIWLDLGGGNVQIDIF